MKLDASCVFEFAKNGLCRWILQFGLQAFRDIKAW